MSVDSIQLPPESERRSPRPVERPAPELLPISALRAADSPRVDGERREHIELLAASEARLPPILVHRQTMRVIDGMHRVRAAALRGQDKIEALFFDGSEQDAFIKAVTANTEHGLPLTRADREAAATRIIVSHPHYSNRLIAAKAGLAPQTVAAIRDRTATGAPVAARVGKDGRARPLDPENGRRIARDAIIMRPGASLREIARIAGISPATVRDVRRRMHQGEDPVHLEHPAPYKPDSAPGQGQGLRRRLGLQASAVRNRPRTPASLLEKLRRDPSLRASQSGRTFLRSIYSIAAGISELAVLTDGVPPHAMYLVSELARSCAEELITFATNVEQPREPGQ